MEIKTRKHAIFFFLKLEFDVSNTFEKCWDRDKFILCYTTSSWLQASETRRANSVVLKSHCCFIRDFSLFAEALWLLDVIK